MLSIRIKIFQLTSHSITNTAVKCNIPLNQKGKKKTYHQQLFLSKIRGLAPSNWGMRCVPQWVSPHSPTCPSTWLQAPSAKNRRRRWSVNISPVKTPIIFTVELTWIACYTALGHHGLKRERRHAQSHQPPSELLCRLFVHVHVAEAPTTSDVEPGHLLYQTHPPACLPPPPTVPAHLPSLFCLFLPLIPPPLPSLWHFYY